MKKRFALNKIIQQNSECCWTPFCSVFSADSSDQPPSLLTENIGYFFRPSMRLPVAWSWVNSSGEIRTPGQLVLSKWSLLRKAIWLRNTYNDVFVDCQHNRLILPPQPVGLCSRGSSACSHDEHHPGVSCPDRVSVGFSRSLFCKQIKKEKKQTTCWFPILLGFWHTAAWVRRERNFSARLFSPCPSSLPSGEIFFLFTRSATLSPSFFYSGLKVREWYSSTWICVFFSSLQYCFQSDLAGWEAGGGLFPGHNHSVLKVSAHRFLSYSQ